MNLFHTHLPLLSVSVFLSSVLSQKAGDKIFQMQGPYGSVAEPGAELRGEAGRLPRHSEPALQVPLDRLFLETAAESAQRRLPQY